MVTINDLSYKNIDLWWNKAWEISQGPLFEWKERIEEAWQEKKIGVNRFLNKLESFYGVDAPERVRILLNFSPIEGNQKGEPTTNFLETEWLFAKNTDILYWVGKPRVSPSDSKKTIPELYRQWAVLVIVSTLHEIEHNYFQKESFRKLLEKAGKEKDINNMVLKLVGTSGTYINVLNELITTYIENYGKKMLEEKWDEGGIGTELIFEVDENKAKEVLKMEFYEDQVKWTGQGPYSEHRQGWEKLMGVLRKSKADKTKNSDNYRGRGVYGMARELDLGLAEKYLANKKELDLEFIRALLEMAAEKNRKIEYLDRRRRETAILPG